MSPRKIEPSAIVPLAEYSAQRAREMHPIKRQPRPDELAFAVAFLCSERARHVQGTAIAVDGGATSGLY